MIDLTTAAQRPEDYRGLVVREDADGAIGVLIDFSDSFVSLEMADGGSCRTVPAGAFQRGWTAPEEKKASQMALELIPVSA